MSAKASDSTKMSNKKVMAKRPTHARCRAIGCDHRKDKNDCVFSVFPSNVDRCKKWLKAVGVNDLVALPISKLNTIRFICSCHFNPTDYKMTKTGKRLCRDAIPSVFNENVIPLADVELEKFGEKEPLTTISNNRLPLSIDEVKGSTQYSFHNMFAQLKNEEHNVSSKRLVEPSVSMVEPSLCINDEPSLESSNKEEVETSQQRSISSTAMVYENKRLPLQIDEVKGSTQYSFHNMFAQLKNEEHNVSSKRLDEPSVSMVEPSLCKNDEPSLESSNIEEVETSQKRSISSAAMVNGNKNAVEQNTQKFTMEQVGLKGVPISPKKAKLILVIHKQRRTINDLEDTVHKQQELIDRLLSSSNINSNIQ